MGMTGSIGSGKTTFAEYLAEQTDRHAHFESWIVVAEVANKLRRATSQHPPATDTEAINSWLHILPSIVTEVCHKPVDFEQIRLTPTKLREAPDNYAKLLQYLELMTSQPHLQDDDITEETKAVFRSLLQWLGGYFVKTVGAGIWYDELISRVQNTESIDLATIGGVRFPGDARRVVSAGGRIICISRPDIVTQDASEITERERGLIVPDTTIINDAGLPDLLSCAAKLWKDLHNDCLVTTYTASKVQA